MQMHRCSMQMCLPDVHNRCTDVLNWVNCRWQLQGQGLLIWPIIGPWIRALGEGSVGGVVGLGTHPNCMRCGFESHLALHFSQWCLGIIVLFPFISYQRNLRYPPRFDLSLFQDGCQIVVRTDAGLTVYSDSGFADNKYCFSLVLL